VNEQVVGTWRGTDEFVEFYLQDFLVPGLGVLNHEEHDQGNSAYDRRECRFPCPRKTIHTKENHENRDQNGRHDRRARARRELAHPMKDSADPLQ
jgi:hypothetical protein